MYFARGWSAGLFFVTTTWSPGASARFETSLAEWLLAGFFFVHRYNFGHEC
jgi:hypothetical protein